MGYANRRKFEIGGTAYEAKKSMFAGHKRTNAKGEWIYFWYAKPVAAGDSKDNWEPVGRTLADLERWIKAKEKEAT